ncbi:NAD(P)H-dependent flavin oxidoreductase [Bdellovibrio sp. HCB2-146]|uniref:NAD(P)H-dependent flavin oxidoreductase n=1 Tax=Bdellovibrio sp. HCB2-146 TaxID=3394362 RepID=UPI0039BD879E
MSSFATSLTQQFQLRLPLFLAPMAGGPTTPELVAAVNEAGGLGFLGVAYMKPSEIESTIQRLRALSSRPFGVNLFIPSPDPILTREQIQNAVHATEKFRQELHLGEPHPQPPYSENFDQQFEVVLKNKPTTLSFTFGLLAKEYIQECKKQKLHTIGTATTLEEAQMIADSGVDAIVLQGFEGGGHRGIFDTNVDDPNISALELTKMCAAKIKLPLITAGGIMNGRGIADAIKAGASAAQLGTAFLACTEAGTSKPYRDILLKNSPKITRLTRAFSGRLARGIENRFMLEMQQHSDSILPWPAQNVFTRDLRKASAEQNSPDFLSLWAGTGVNSLRPMKAADLIETLLSELHNA